MSALRKTWIPALALLLLCQPAQATPLEVDLEDGADHHLSAQGDYAGGIPSSWEWRFGSKRSSSNIVGINAQGMLAAHRLTGLDAHQASALAAAKSLVAAYDKGWKNRRPKTQDIEFLAAAGYVIDAGTWFDVIKRRWTAERFVDYVIAARGQGKAASLAGWDIASAMRAALAVGQVPYARGLFQRLVARRGRWDVRDRLDAQNLSAGSLLWAIADYQGWSRLSPAEARFAASLLRRVSAAQTKGGGITTPAGSEICTQTTAYAALGLARWAQGKRASLRARRYLQRVAITDERFFLGGRIWASSYDLKGTPSARFISEIQSEVLMALATGNK